jgi:class 3 adenylate cyclase/esterase/lipase
MDAAGSDRAALFGWSEGGAMSLLFAATYPDRTRALALYAAYAHCLTCVRTLEETRAFIEQIEHGWGTGVALQSRNPSAAADENIRRQWGRIERMSASPAAAIGLLRMNTEIDVRPILSAVRVPTLVLHRDGDHVVQVAGGRYLAEHIPEAKYIELRGVDHSPFLGDSDRLVEEIETFLTGSRTPPEPDRLLATVLFTDIVGSTKQAVALGDRNWLALLGQHHSIVRQELERFRGHELNTLGDGFVATFDGPTRGVRCATAIIEKLRPLGIEVRCGLHTGEIEIGHDDVGGIAVHTAARVADLASTGEVLVSSTVRDPLPAPAFSSATAAATHSADYRRRCEYSRPESGLLHP